MPFFKFSLDTIVRFEFDHYYGKFDLQLYQTLDNPQSSCKISYSLQLPIIIVKTVNLIVTSEALTLYNNKHNQNLRSRLNLQLDKGWMAMERQGNFAIGLFWGASLSVPLWIAFFGWLRMMLHYLQ